MEKKQLSTLVTKGDKVGFVCSSDGKLIQIKGGRKAQQAVQTLSRFGLIRFSRDQFFKSSSYSIHFIKPVSKLQQLYNLGEEVLILCCNDSMNNFKSRTKDFIDYILGSQSEFRNRLDKVTCFLVDDCDDIEKLIKQDRSENPDSRLIVPFSYSELEDGISEEAFQIRLRTFLYERDLFGVASPLKDDVLFFGKSRFDIISELYGKYLQGEHGGLFGLRRIGKTSILNLLRNRVEQNGGVAVYLDCTKYYHLRWNSFLHQIIYEIFNKYSIGNTETPVGSLPESFALISKENYTEETASLSFEADLKSLHHSLNNRRILLIFDEIERISFGTSPSNNWREENDALYFWDTLRAISQTDDSVFSFVIAGVNPKCIEDSKIVGQTNPIFNTLTPQYITLFDYDDVKTMISAIGGHLGLYFEEEVYSKLVDDYGGHPFLTRQVCSKINADVLSNKESRPFCVSKYSYEKQAPDYRSKLEGVIQQILGVLEEFYPEEYDLLKVLALDGSYAFKKKLSFGENKIDHLLGYCLITRDHGDYFIRIKTVAAYLNEKHKYEKSLDSESEKRARITVRRGLIEEKLRKIIQTNLTLKFGKKAKEHMISIAKNATTDKSQEAKLQSKEFKEAMQELYFSQLKVLMIKDWNSYQSIFADKVKFEQFFDIINSHRADAHAKSLDEEEEAILCCAFKFFEKALEDI